jgi:hypothetical protein
MELKKERRMKGKMTTLILASAMAGAAALGLLSPTAAKAGDDCTTKKFTYPAVEKACKSGGQKAAKSLMKAAVKKAKADGKEYKCKSCHEDTDSFKLKDNAVDDLKPYI